MDDITIEVSEFVNNISVTAQPNDQTIDITVTETVETVLLDVSNTVNEVTVTATQNVIVENITVDYVNNENNIDINVTDATQDVTLNITPTLVEINILRSGGEVNILQFDSLADFPTTGSSDYFYLAKDTNKLYRWTGSAYAEISATANAVWGQIIGTLSEQTDLQNALNLKAPINSPTFTGTVSGINKGMVGLGAVDNTSDLDKPISTATQTALNAKQPLDADLTSIAALSGTFGLLKKTANNSYTIDTNTYLTGITSSDVTTALGYTPENVANKGVNNGYASLDGGGKVPSSQLPSYVDDVIEVSSFATLPTTGETGKIYITLDTNKIYRWTGSVYVEVSSSAAVWGGITGTLSNQTDLQTALDAKQDDLNGTGFVKASGTTISYDNTTYYPASNPNGYTSNVGTVTSVALTVPSAFTVSGSPVTSSGTLAVTATGNTTQYIAGDGSLVTFPTMSTAGTLIREVRNTTGATLTKGTVVYISGATGNKPTVSKALATGDSTSAQTFGLVQADIANNANGNVVCAGDITGIDTSAFTEGAQLYLSSTTAGTYTTTKQLAPNHLVYIGVVTRAHPTLGQIEVNIQNGYELYELHDVSITSVANNQGLFYEASTDLWKNKSIATVLGYTPANGADYMALSGDQTIAGLKTFSGFGLFDHNIFIKQGTDTSFLSGYNVIDASSTGIFIGLPNTYGANLVLSNLTTQRNFTFPNASGTIALTSDIPSSAGFVATTGDQSIGGDKTFTGDVINDGDLYIKQDASFAPKTGYVNLFAGAGNILTYNFGNSNTNQSLSFPTNSRVYSFPDATGTLALTSELHNAVTIGTANGLSLSTQVLSLGLASTTTTGALSSTDWNTFNNKASTAALGNYLPLSGGTISASSSSDALRVVNGGTGYALYVQSNAFFQGDAGFQSVGTNAMVKTNSSRNLVAAVAGTDYVVPSALSAYLPLSGGTLTGALSGTSATFSSSLIVGSTSILYGNVAIKSNSATSYFGLNVIANGNNNFVALNHTGTAGVIETEFSTGGSHTPLQFVTGGTTRMIITTSGNVGIGTTAPSAVLEVAGTSATSDFRISRTVSSSTYFYIKAPGGSPSASSMGVNGTDVMTLNASGNVGIGTTAPVAVSGHTSLTVNSSNVARIDMTVSNVQKGLIATTDSSYLILSQGSIPLVLGTNDTERMRITSGGNLLVGTTSDNGAKLRVSGLNQSSSFVTDYGNASIPFGSYGTFYTVSNYQNALYMVTLQYNGYSGYTAYAIIAQNDSALVVMHQVNNNAQIQVSGLNIQGKNDSGVTVSMVYKIIKIG